MKGQWFGRFDGGDQGWVIANLDERPGGFSGSCALFESDENLPGSSYNIVLSVPDANSATIGHADFNFCFDKFSTFASTSLGTC